MLLTVTYNVCNEIKMSISNVICTIKSQGDDLSDATEGDPKYLAPELMDGKFGKPADVFR